MNRLLRSRCIGLLAGLACLLALPGCDDFRREFTVATFPTDYITSMSDIASIMSVQIQSRIESRTLTPAEDRLELLTSGEIDFTFISNSTPYREDVYAVMPLYRDVLHIFHRKDLKPKDGMELMKGKLIYTDPGSTALQKMLEIFVYSSKLSQDDFRITHNIEDQPDVIFHFAPLLSRDFSKLEQDYRLFSVGNPDQLHQDNRIDAIHYIFPQVQTFVIPAQVYGDINPGPIITLSVDNILVTNADTPALFVYWLCHTIARHRNIFTDKYPAAFDYVGKEFDPGLLNFPLHPGAKAYLDRDEPTFLERYAEVINTLLYCIALIVSGFYALGKWNDLRKKNRIDVYYAQLMDIRRKVQQDKTASSEALLDQIRRLEHEAIGLLIDEKLTANESMTIFLLLAQTISGEIANRDAVRQVT